VIVGAIGLWMFPGDRAAAERKRVSREFGGADIGMIDVSCSWANVELRPVSGDAIELAYMDGGEWTVEESRGALTVRVRNFPWSFWNLFRLFERDDTTLWIGIPAAFDGDMRIATASGSVAIAADAVPAGEFAAESVSSFPALNDVEIVSASGSVRAAGLALSNFSATTASGNIALEGVRAVQCYASSVSGAVELRDVEADGVRLKSVSGDISLDAVAPVAALEANSTSGSIRGSVAALEEDTTISASTVSGSVRVPRGADSGKTTLRFKTVSGNIDVSLVRP
jgi:DUF4097 and DUF4098 domain-containing protein YvlB